MSKPLQAALMAGIAPHTLAPAHMRALEQWCEVLPVHAVASALHQTYQSAYPLEDFRQVVLAMMRGDVTLPTEEVVSDASPSGTPRFIDRPTRKIEAKPKTEADKYASLSQADREALAAQDCLESMSDTDYQQELVQRLHTRHHNR